MSHKDHSQIAVLGLPPILRASHAVSGEGRSDYVATQMPRLSLRPMNSPREANPLRPVVPLCGTHSTPEQRFPMVPSTSFTGQDEFGKCPSARLQNGHVELLAHDLRGPLRSGTQDFRGATSDIAGGVTQRRFRHQFARRHRPVHRRNRSTYED